MFATWVFFRCQLRRSVARVLLRIQAFICTFLILVLGKMCKKPPVLDSRAFPKSVFSGGGDGNNGYARARISSGGWCASGSGTYLALDLQKEYHITQVVVMADKEQTNWSGSYSIKYSYDMSYENSKQVFTITIKYCYKCSKKNFIKFTR